MKKTIYVLEDNPDISELIGYLLSGSEYNVMPYATVLDFQLKMVIDLPDMVILDIMLPDGNGLDICRELKSKPETRQIPVLLMSAHIAGKMEAREVAADDFISKPFDIDDFTERVRRCLAS
jgi:two-component system phosphate regulon response regulator PhoB